MTLSDVLGADLRRVGEFRNAFDRLRRFAADGPADDRQYLLAVRATHRARRLARGGGLAPAAAGLVESALAMTASGLRLYELRRGDYLRTGRWTQTHSGRRFWPEDPRPEECDVRDIAWGLSRIARYYGATCGAPFSVAQHCVLGSYFCPGHELEFLLHDAPEAYVGDVASHIKRLLGDAYARLESGIMDAVARAFGAERTDETEAAVAETDARMLATEVDQLLSFGVINHDALPDPLPLTLTPWPAEAAYRAYLSRFRELAGG
jgi:hypothetical protein